MGQLIDQTLLESFYEAMQEADGLTKVRAKSWARFCEGGLPEKIRYLPLKSLYAQKVELPTGCAISPEAVKRACLSDSYLVFADGQLLPELSQMGGAAALPLSQAGSAYGTFLANRTSRLLKGESDPFSLLNGALHGDGAFLYLPSGTRMKEPLHLIHFVSEGALASPRLHLYAGPGVEIELISSLVSPSPFWMNGLIDLAVEENAYVKLTHLTDTPAATLFNSVRATQKRDSRLEIAVADRGGRSSRHDIRVSLLEENSDVRLSGAFCLSDSRAAHADILVEHLAPHCTSAQLFKTLLADVARSSFVGKIWVGKEAQKTDAFQLNNNLLLSDRAIAYSEPNLEIFADDVKASHGSTTGQLGEEELFYLTSRGVATKVAKQLLVRGFIGEVAARLAPSCRQSLNQWAEDVTD